MTAKTRFPIYAGAWAATLAVTFAVARVTAPDVPTSAGKGSKSSVPATAVANSASETGRSQDAAAKAEEDIIARVFGSHATDLEQVLGSRTLSDHVKQLARQEDDAVRMLGFLRLLEALNNPEDFQTALDALGGESNGRLRATEQAMLLQKWAQMKPAEAAKYASEQRDWSRFNGMNPALRTWLKSSSEEAIAWAEQNGVATGEQQGRGRDEGNWAVATMMGPLAQQNLDRALQVAANQPVSRARGRMVDTLISEFINQRGDDAARNAIGDLPDDAFRAGMAARLAEKLAPTDPKATAAWAWTLPSGDTRERAIADTINVWAEKDPVAAGQYLQQLGTSPDLDSARERYAARVLPQDPEGSMVWAMSITDEKQRANATQGLLRQWMRRDQAAATTWASANGMPVEPTPPRGYGRMQVREQ